jgi:uncharacterized iron-regulated protein
MRISLLAVALSTALVAQSGYVPERVYDSAKHEFSDFESMLADIAKADVALIGEEHDDANTHRLELAVLEGLARRRGAKVVVGFEMFERDVQEPFDHFQMGHMDEPEFLKSSRPWPNYATDYKPLVDFALKREWPLFASSVPRALAAEVSSRGLDVLAAKSGDALRWFAKDVNCAASGDYFDRFADAMGAHPAKDAPKKPQTAESAAFRDPASAPAGPPALSKAALEHYYQAQCLKDETMGESIAQAYAAGAIGGKHPLVVHFNGAFHSDFGEGTAERVKRRLPGRRILIVTMLPVTSLDAPSPDKNERKRADFLVYTLKNDTGKSTFESQESQ